MEVKVEEMQEEQAVREERKGLSCNVPNLHSPIQKEIFL
jgi:hypothetical protein